MKAKEVTGLWRATWVVSQRASKLQVFKVRLLWDLNPGPPREPLNIGKLAHAGVPGSNPGEAEL